AAGDLVFYQVPMTYRGDPLPAAGEALIGTAKHGVLGLRWIYDGVRDPVLVAALVACVQGEAAPQAQNVSDAPDPTVLVKPPVTRARLAPAVNAVFASGASGTDLHVRTADSAGQCTIRLNRILLPDGSGTGEPGGHPCVSATWRLPDGTSARGA